MALMRHQGAFVKGIKVRDSWDIIQLDFAPFADIFKVDVGDSVVISVLHHAASQAPLLGVRAELQDLDSVATIIATWILTSAQGIYS